METTTVKQIVNQMKIKKDARLTPLEKAYLSLLGFKFFPVRDCPGWGELVATNPDCSDVCVVALSHLRSVMELGLTSPDEFFEVICPEEEDFSNWYYGPYEAEILPRNFLHG